jgi:hypothetical protein
MWGGADGSGTVYEVARTAIGYANAPTVLASFNGPDGAILYGDLIADANGNLFGTTYTGGTFGYGTVFEIAKTAHGYARTPTTLVSFNGSDGAYSSAGLIVDANGPFRYDIPGRGDIWRADLPQLWHGV